LIRDWILFGEVVVDLPLAAGRAREGGEGGGAESGKLLEDAVPKVSLLLTVGIELGEAS
jgi:hypothetical protein